MAAGSESGSEASIIKVDRVVTAENLRDAIDAATALVDDARVVGGAEDDAFSGTGIVITGSVVTAGAARTLFARDPE